MTWFFFSRHLFLSVKWKNWNRSWCSALVLGIQRCGCLRIKYASTYIVIICTYSTFYSRLLTTFFHENEFRIFMSLPKKIMNKQTTHIWLWLLTKTSLKIFKHYMLKPSFSIIKDDKAKDRAGVGVGDKPPPPNYGRSINPNLTQFLYFI